MHEKLDRYDTHAVFIPGTAGVIVALYLHCGSATELMSIAKDFDIGHGIILLFMGYVMGEFLQMLGKTYEKVLFFLLGGDPLTWIFEPKRPYISQLQIWLRHIIGRLVNDATKEQFMDYLRHEGKGAPNELSGPQDLYPLYDKIKSDAYQTEAQKEECLKMLSKSGMYLSFCTLIALVLVHKIVQACLVGWELSKWTVSPMNGWGDKGHTIPVLIFLSLLLFILTRRFLFFNLRYNQSLITGYLHAKKNEKAPEEAQEETECAPPSAGVNTKKGCSQWFIGILKAGIRITLFIWFVIFLTHIDSISTTSPEPEHRTNMNTADEHTRKLLALLEFDGELTTEEKRKLKSHIESGLYLPRFVALNMVAGNKPLETASKRTFDEQIFFYFALYHQVKQDCLGEQ